MHKEHAASADVRRFECDCGDVTVPADHKWPRYQSPGSVPPGIIAAVPAIFVLHATDRAKLSAAQVAEIATSQKSDVRTLLESVVFCGTCCRVLREVKP